VGHSAASLKRDLVSSLGAFIFSIKSDKRQ